MQRFPNEGTSHRRSCGVREAASLERRACSAPKVRAAIDESQPRGDEGLSYSGKAGNTLTGVRRGILGTAATSHPASAVVVSASVEGTIRSLFGHQAEETGTDWNRDEKLNAPDLPRLLAGGSCPAR